ncbi:MAG TPA: hypothetical protein VK705_04550 [Ferruginibacter sp.]|jgi:hypothetical protein|nr:hypothetical protein [Ferruginibacter sp.]
MSNHVSTQFTKEAIMNRLMQNAANLWGVKNPSSLDPFVRMLMEAFSLEIYRAANETQNIEGRILDKIAGMLTPNLLTMPHAAHAILQATPAESIHVLHPQTSFQAKKRYSSRTGGMLDLNVDVNFTPIDHAHLIKGKLCYMAAGYQLFNYDDTGNKLPMLRTTSPLPWSTCIIGIEVDDAVNNLEDVSLYFNFPFFEDKPWVYQLLPLCNVSYNDKEIKIESGRKNNETYTEQALDEDLFKSYDLMYQLMNDVKILYQQKFLTLDDCDIIDRKQTDEIEFPQILLDSFDAVTLKAKASNKVVWLKIEFPSNYTYEVLENLYVTINAFPVINRRLINHTYNYSTLNNILPLHVESHEKFMTVQRVSDGHDRVFREIPVNQSDKISQGYYSIRYGGAERFDQRSAQDIVNYLLELTKDEVAAFASMQQDFMFTLLEDLSRQLKLIHTRTENVDVDIRQVPTYLIAESYEEKETLQVDYWVTQGDLGNGLRTGTTLSIKNSTEIVSNTIVLLTDTTGGREKLQAGERLNAYRYAMSSHERLITNEDIRNFCKYELQGKLKEVKFEKGLSLSDHPKEGYIRTLDIKLQPHRYTDHDASQWNYLTQNLLTKIKDKSPDGIHYRVMVEN